MKDLEEEKKISIRIYVDKTCYRLVAIDSTSTRSVSIDS